MKSALLYMHMSTPLPGEISSGLASTCARLLSYARSTILFTVPFLPPAPEAITYSAREQALAKRMGGERIPAPFYGEERLAEIVLKACSFSPKERYSSPVLMRQELEAILYSEDASGLIYPDGDELTITENKYVSQSSGEDHSTEMLHDDDETRSVFSSELKTARELDG